MLAALASDSGSAGRAAQPAMPRADAQPRPRRCATARSHGVSPESVISRGRIARLMLPRFAAVNFQQGLKPRHARGHPASRIARIYPWFCSQFPPAGPPPAQAQSRRFVTAPGDPAYGGQQTLRRNSFAANTAGSNARLVGWRPANGLALRSRTTGMAAEHRHAALLETACDSPRAPWAWSLPPWSPR